MDWRTHFGMMSDMHAAHAMGQCWAKCAFCAASTDLLIVTKEQRERMRREEFEVSESASE